MSTDRYQMGWKKLKEVDGEAGEKVVESLKGIAPDLARYIVEFAFVEIYTRESLNLREREMITLASLLTAGGCEAQLEVHIKASLHVGMSKEEIIECFLQCIPYTGFPKVLNGVAVAKKCFS